MRLKGTDGTLVNPISFISVSGDCNDNELAINPVATEICDDVDNNCDGQVHE